MKLKKWQKILMGIITTLFVMIIVGFTFLKINTYSPSSEAEKISTTSSQNSDYLLFKGEDNQKNFIFYPGALVEPASYSIWAENLAKEGINVYIMKMPLNLAVFGENAAQKIIEQNPNETYILGGHSLGGVMASRFAFKHVNEISGMIYLASYPDEKGSLQETNLPTLLLTATNDQLVLKEDIEKSKPYLSENTTYEVITGGNHSGFGSYGQQKKDGKATISNSEQQVEITEFISQWLKENY